AEGLGHVAHRTARVVAHEEQDLRLRERQVELGRALPQELPERRASEGVQKVEEALGLGGEAGRPPSCEEHAAIMDRLNSLVNKRFEPLGRPAAVNAVSR